MVTRPRKEVLDELEQFASTATDPVALRDKLYELEAGSGAEMGPYLRAMAKSLNDNPGSVSEVAKDAVGLVGGFRGIEQRLDTPVSQTEATFPSATAQLPPAAEEDPDKNLFMQAHEYITPYAEGVAKTARFLSKEIPMFAATGGLGSLGQKALTNIALRSPKVAAYLTPMLARVLGYSGGAGVAETGRQLLQGEDLGEAAKSGLSMAAQTLVPAYAGERVAGMLAPGFGKVLAQGGTEAVASPIVDKIVADLRGRPYDAADALLSFTLGGAGGAVGGFAEGVAEQRGKFGGVETVSPMARKIAAHEEGLKSSAEWGFPGGVEASQQAAKEIAEFPFGKAPVRPMSRQSQKAYADVFSAFEKMAEADPTLKAVIAQRAGLPGDAYVDDFFEFMRQYNTDDELRERIIHVMKSKVGHKDIHTPETLGRAFVDLVDSQEFSRAKMAAKDFGDMIKALPDELVPPGRSEMSDLMGSLMAVYEAADPNIKAAIQKQPRDVAQQIMKRMIEQGSLSPRDMERLRVVIGDITVGSEYGQSLLGRVQKDLDRVMDKAVVLDPDLNKRRLQARATYAKAKDLGRLAEKFVKKVRPEMRAKSMPSYSGIGEDVIKEALMTPESTDVADILERVGMPREDLTGPALEAFTSKLEGLPLGQQETALEGLIAKRPELDAPRDARTALQVGREELAGLMDPSSLDSLVVMPSDGAAKTAAKTRSQKAYMRFLTNAPQDARDGFDQIINKQIGKDIIDAKTGRIDVDRLGAIINGNQDLMNRTRSGQTFRDMFRGLSQKKPRALAGVIATLSAEGAGTPFDQLLGKLSNEMRADPKVFFDAMDMLDGYPDGPKIRRAFAESFWGNLASPPLGERYDPNDLVRKLAKVSDRNLTAVFGFDRDILRKVRQAKSAAERTAPALTAVGKPATGLAVTLRRGASLGGLVAAGGILGGVKGAALSAAASYATPRVIGKILLSDSLPEIMEALTKATRAYQVGRQQDRGKTR